MLIFKYPVNTLNNKSFRNNNSALDYFQPNMVNFTSITSKDTIQKFGQSGIKNSLYLQRMENILNENITGYPTKLHKQSKILLNSLSELKPGVKVSLDSIYYEKHLEYKALRDLLFRLKKRELIILETAEDNVDTLISVTEKFAQIIDSLPKTGSPKGSRTPKIVEEHRKPERQKVSLPVNIQEQIHAQTILPQEAKNLEKVEYNSFTDAPVAQELSLENVSVNNEIPVKNVQSKSIIDQETSKYYKTNLEIIARLIYNQPTGDYTKLTSAEKAFVNYLLKFKSNETVTIDTICRNEKLLITDIDNFVLKLAENDLINLYIYPNNKSKKNKIKSIHVSPTSKITSIHDTDSNLQIVIKSGMLILDSDFSSKMPSDANKTVLTLINKKIKEGKIKKIESGSKTIIQFDKNNPGEISSLLEQLSRNIIPVLLILPQKAKSKGLDYKGINTCFCNYAEGINSEILNNKFVAESGFIIKEQKMIKYLSEKGPKSLKQLVQVLDSKIVGRSLGAVNNLLKLNIIKKFNSKTPDNPFLYKLTDEYLNILDKNKLTEREIQEFRQLIELANDNWIQKSISKDIFAEQQNTSISDKQKLIAVEIQELKLLIELANNYRIQKSVSNV